MFFAVFDFVMCLLWAVLIILFQNELYKSEEPAFTVSVLTLQNYYQFGCNFVQQTTKYKQWVSRINMSHGGGVVLKTFLEMFHINWTTEIQWNLSFPIYYPLFLL